jgi:hypothetical protein
MKLSEAIRKGSKLPNGEDRKQVTGHVFTLDWDDGNAPLCACSIGAALLGAGIVQEDEKKQELLLQKNRVRCGSVLGNYDLFVENWSYFIDGKSAEIELIDLNDGDKMSFEEVASYLESKGF